MSFFPSRQWLHTQLKSHRFQNHNLGSVLLKSLPELFSLVWLYQSRLLSSAVRATSSPNAGLHSKVLGWLGRYARQFGNFGLPRERSTVSNAKHSYRSQKNKEHCITMWSAHGIIWTYRQFPICIQVPFWMSVQKSELMSVGTALLQRCENTRLVWPCLHESINTAIPWQLNAFL